MYQYWRMTVDKVYLPKVNATVSIPKVNATVDPRGCCVYSGNLLQLNNSEKFAVYVLTIIEKSLL